MLALLWAAKMTAGFVEGNNIVSTEDAVCHGLSLSTTGHQCTWQFLLKNNATVRRKPVRFMVSAVVVEY
jgi:hypothetical protein